MLAVAAWALASLPPSPGAAPPAAWHAALCACLLPRAAELSAREAAMAAWALGQMGLPVEGRLVDALEGALGAHDHQVRAGGVL